MPTYEYRCNACGHEFEKVQRITADAVKQCPSCGEPQAERLISQGNFILKGGGWYAEGYGLGKSGAKSADKVGSANGAGTSATSGATETPGTAKTSDSASPAKTDSKSKSAGAASTATKAKASSGD